MLFRSGKGLVRERAFEEIRRLDAGGWFDPRFSAERVPELSEVLELTAGRCLLNIEIKTSAFEADFPGDAIERQVVESVKTDRAMDLPTRPCCANAVRPTADGRRRRDPRRRRVRAGLRSRRERKSCDGTSCRAYSGRARRRHASSVPARSAGQSS